jgi:hypothetical protein
MLSTHAFVVLVTKKFIHLPRLAFYRQQKQRIVRSGGLLCSPHTLQVQKLRIHTTILTLLLKGFTQPLYSENRNYSAVRAESECPPPCNLTTKHVTKLTNLRIPVATQLQHRAARRHVACRHLARRRRNYCATYRLCFGANIMPSTPGLFELSAGTFGRVRDSSLLHVCYSRRLMTDTDIGVGCHEGLPEIARRRRIRPSCDICLLSPFRVIRCTQWLHG